MSGLDGAEMREIAQAVAAELKYAVVDEEIVLQAAACRRPRPGRRSPTRSVAGPSSSGRSAASVRASTPARLPVAGAGYTAGMGLGEDIRGLLVQAIEEAADRGEVVIAAHAASHALAERPDVVRVLVTASPETRRARVAAERKSRREGSRHGNRAVRLRPCRLPEALLRHQARAPDPVRPRREHRSADHGRRRDAGRARSQELRGPGAGLGRRLQPPCPKKTVACSACA